MLTGKKYLFTSERLGFRDWLAGDEGKMAAINADPEVMEFFHALQTRAQTVEFIQRMRQHLVEKGFCYFAVDRLEDGICIGFIGLLEQTFAADFTPCVDIGWRLCREAWNKGYATEGAARCLEYGFRDLGLKKIVAIAPAVNRRSEQVMIKAGMKRVKVFCHPKLAGNKRLEECVLYEKLSLEF